MWFLYTLLYGLVAFCFIMPPNEFISAGLTFDTIFSSIIERNIRGENLDFVQYHIRRVSTNVIAQSTLPFFYFALADLIDDKFNIHTPVQILSKEWIVLFPFLASVMLMVAAPLLVLYWHANNSQNHPIVRKLRRYFTSTNAGWASIADSINNEYCTLDKFSVYLGGARRVIVTSSWIIYVHTYGVDFAQQADAKLTIVASSEHEISHHTTSHNADRVQFLSIMVEAPVPDRGENVKFTIQLNARDFHDLKNAVRANIDIARDVIIKASISDRFVEAFTREVEQNGPIDLNENALERIDPCLGCGVVMSNVKLQKECDDNNRGTDQNNQPLPRCIPCFCRPMWCVSCFARWFANKQPEAHPERWLSGKSPCPTCRATFCVLDVRRVRNVPEMIEEL